jgi:DNA-binding NtrC family response regulator
MVKTPTIIGEAHVKPVILLVDDEADLVHVLRDAVELALPKYDAVSSTNVDDAELLLAEHGGALSLVCVDHRLGGRTGLEFIEQLRERFPDVPSILFTGQASTSVADRARQAGARVLWKPIRLSQWLGEVQALLDGEPAVV